MRTTVQLEKDIWIWIRLEVEKRRLAGEKATIGGILAKMLRAAMELAAKKQ
jgi:hypothetical protein